MKKRNDSNTSNASSRRRVLQSMGVSAVAVTGASQLPTAWRKPLIDTVVMPAHAQTSRVGPGAGVTGGSSSGSSSGTTTGSSSGTTTSSSSGGATGSGSGGTTTGSSGGTTGGSSGSPPASSSSGSTPDVV